MFKKLLAIGPIVLCISASITLPNSLIAQNRCPVVGDTVTITGQVYIRELNGVKLPDLYAKTFPNRFQPICILVQPYIGVGVGRVDRVVGQVAHIWLVSSKQLDVGGLIGKASYSTVTLTLTGTSGANINNGVVSDVNGNFWYLPKLVTLGQSNVRPIVGASKGRGIGGGGSATAIATARVLGNITANAGAITNIVTPTAGWTGVTNLAAAVPGQAVEPIRFLEVTGKITAEGANRIASFPNELPYEVTLEVSEIKDVDAEINKAVNAWKDDCVKWVNAQLYPDATATWKTPPRAGERPKVRGYSIEPFATVNGVPEPECAASLDVNLATGGYVGGMNIARFPYVVNNLGTISFSESAH